MLGNARGKTTRQRIWLSDPREPGCLDIPFIHALNTCCRVMKMGKKEQIKTIRIGSISLIPTQSINNGSQPRAGMGYKTLARGSKKPFGNPVPSGKDTQK